MAILRALTDFSLRRAGLVLLAVVAVAVGGILAVRDARTELIPDIELPVLTVIAQYPGAGPQDVAAQLAAPIEQAAATLPGLKRVQSVSAEGLAVVAVELEYGSDLDAAEEALREQLQRAPLPEGVAQPEVAAVDAGLLPVVLLSVSGDLPPSELAALAAERLVPAIHEVDGVFAVEVQGGGVQELVVELDAARLAAAGLTVDQVAERIRANQVALPSGVVVDGTQPRTVRTVSLFTSPEELAALAVGLAPDGSPLRLGELGTVRLAEAAASGVSRTNGRPSVALAVAKTEQANTVDVANGVLAAVEAVRPELPAGVAIDVTLDQSTFIEESLAGLLREGLIGGVFAVLVVFLFLRSLRSTVVTAVSIPLSVLAALILLHWQGLSLNIMTLGGLTIAVGRVIDDSIVVLENIVRRLEEGEPLAVAVREGTGQVGAAITGATLTTVAVFLPLGLVGGLVGELFRSFALAVTASLLASLLVALTVIPVLASRFVGRREAHRAGEETGWLSRAYTPVLRWALRHRAATLAVAVGLFAGSVALIPLLPVTFFPASGEPLIAIEIAAPGDPVAVERAAAAVEELVAAREDVVLYQTAIGSAGGSLQAAGAVLGGQGLGAARLFVRLEAGADRGRAEEELRRAIEALDLPADVRLSDMTQAGGTSVQVIVSGQDRDAVARGAEQVAAAMREVAGLAQVRSDLAASRPEVAVRVDPGKALARGLTAAEVAQRLRALTLGETVTQVTLGDGGPGAGRTVDVRVVLAGGPFDAAALAALPVAPGVPLGDVAAVATVDGQPQITRVDGQPAATVSGEVTAANTGAVSDEVRRQVEALALPPGVSARLGGIAEQIREGFRAMLVGIAVAVVLVYLVMVLTFGSFLEPFVILCSLPLASVGAVAALLVTGRTLGMPALIGVLMLVGIVVTNAIVLIDFVKQLREQGLSAEDALVAGGRARLRPILMTALATVLALIPMALGLHEGALIAAELATVVIGGLGSATLLTLIVVPVAYSVADSLRVRLARRREPAEVPA
ncbi:MAG TPA: efflux RND transporter permease subunit [Thermaerobacter sp.]